MTNILKSSSLCEPWAWKSRKRFEGCCWWTQLKPSWIRPCCAFAHCWTTPASQNTLRKWVVLPNVAELLCFPTDLFPIVCVCRLYDRLLSSPNLANQSRKFRHHFDCQEQVHAKLPPQKTTFVLAYFVTFKQIFFFHQITQKLIEEVLAREATL